MIKFYMEMLSALETKKGRKLAVGTEVKMKNDVDGIGKLERLLALIVRILSDDDAHKPIASL